MTRTTRKEICKQRVLANIAFNKRKGPYSAVELLELESMRLHFMQMDMKGLQPRTSIRRLSWAFHVSSAWLSSRVDPAIMHKFKEVKP